MPATSPGSGGLRVKVQRPDAAITYARRASKRGDARHWGGAAQGKSR